MMTVKIMRRHELDVAVDRAEFAARWMGGEGPDFLLKPHHFT